MISFSGLSKSNFLYFLFPNYLYPLNHNPIKNYQTIRYYTYKRNSDQLIEITTRIYKTDNLKTNLSRFASLIQQPQPYFRQNFQKSTETLYFPVYHLGIIDAKKQNQELIIFFNESVVFHYPYQRKISSNSNKNFLEKFKKALAATIFVNYQEIQNIYWYNVTKNQITMFSRPISH